MYVIFVVCGVQHLTFASIFKSSQTMGDYGLPYTVVRKFSLLKRSACCMWNKRCDASSNVICMSLCDDIMLNIVTKSRLIINN